MDFLYNEDAYIYTDRLLAKQLHNEQMKEVKYKNKQKLFATNATFSWF